MVKLGLVTVEDLVAATAGSSERHAVSARRAAAYVRRGVDSPMETRLRMLIVLAGLPEPMVNHIVRRSNGDVWLRFDLSYPWLKLLIEYDGRQHADDVRQWHRDIERREQLDELGWRLLVVTAKGIYSEPERTIQRVRSALLERHCTNIPRALSDAWRPYFPARG